MEYVMIRPSWAFLFLCLIATPSWTQSDRGPAGASQKSRITKPCGPSFFKSKGAWAAMISCEHASCLDEIAVRLMQDPDLSLVIDGHRNKKERVGISLTRADHLRRYLIEDRNIFPSRIYVRNFSDTCPHEAGDKHLDRRVEYWLIRGDVSFDRIAKLKRCAAGSSPAVIMYEDPMPWKGDWKAQSLQ